MQVSRINTSDENEVKRKELVDYISKTDLVVVTGTGVSLQTAGYPEHADAKVASWVGLLEHGLEYCKTHDLIGEDDTEIIELQLKKATIDGLIDAARQIN